MRLYGQDLHLVVGKRHGDERVRLGGGAGAIALVQLGAGARRAGRAMVAVGDVERGDPREGVDQLPGLVSGRAPDRVLHAVGRGEIVERARRAVIALTIPSTPSEPR